jgi:dextranase
MKHKRIWLSLLLIFSIMLLMFVFRPHPKKNPQKQSPAEVENLFTDLQTDQSRYSPGDQVDFKLDPEVCEYKIKVSYFHLDKKLKEVEFTNKESWSWVPPKNDFKGYLVEVKFFSANTVQTKTIAVDVSSDWSKFPRYGFLSMFSEMPYEDLEKTISTLNRYHINGLQFYDWHFEHQQPLKLNSDSPASHWQDVANRDISLDTIKEYIALAHDRNMETMAYNLLYGSFENRALVYEWHLFKDRERKTIDQHPLPYQWKSNINIMNPTNPWWQDYLIDQQSLVYEALSFDGWHIDQLGDRGEVYNEFGDQILIDESFAPFLTKIKNSFSEKQIVMNAVNQYGQASISQASPAFLYTEVWDEYKYYNDLKKILDTNSSLSGGKSSVLAAYMNYEHSNQPGEFNGPGILLANSVIFANGGAHLELGEHMLSKEYFPHNQLKLPSELEKKVISYYDFLTGYENLLRDQITASDVSLESKEGLPLTIDSAQQNKLWVIAKEKEKKKILHFINFLDANSMEWRDTNGTQAIPKTQKNLHFVMDEPRKVEKIWMSSPDIKAGKPISIRFKQDGKKTEFTLPSLTYWDMVVIEYY